jgi:N-acetylmuramoyl-L-alanine amidase
MPACMRTIIGSLCACLVFFLSGAIAAEKGLAIKGVRYFSYSGFTRIVFEAEEAAPYVLTRSGDGRTLHFSSYGGPFTFKITQLPFINDGVVKSMELRQDGEHRSLLITLGPAAGDTKDFVLRGPDRIVVDVLRGAAIAPLPEALAAKAPVIVLDPGHGGTETGIITGQGVEKALMLELAFSIRKILRQSSARMTVILTRERDQAATLDERAALANASGALLFVSLHAAQGSAGRVFILDPDEGQTSPSSTGRPSDFLGFDAVSEQQQMLWGTQQARHAQESGRLGRDIVRALAAREGAEPSQAPLAQLKAVDAAAVLIEAGTAMNRGKAAEAIAQGIEQYVREKR